MKKDKVHEQRY